MKFEEAVAIGTMASDVEGIPVTKHPIARRKLPAGYMTNIKKRRKKKKKEEEDDSKRSD